MKRLQYAVILLLGLSMATMMSSCKKDNSQLIVGKWEMIEDTRIHFWGDCGTVCAGEKVIFTSEGLTTFPIVDFSIPYEIEGNSLIIDEDEVFSIDQLTSSTLKLSNTEYPNDAQIVLKKVN